jgi:NAD(P)-dependent dehydrogenase (short-subunit alcohol dehydrogenase family)
MIEDLDGRVAVVTGGASGIGLAMGEAFLKAGMTVVLSDVDEPALEREVARLSVTFSDQIRGQVCDVTDNDAVVELANSVRDRHGPVHVLCNNAGVAPAAPILQSTPSQWKWTFDINVLGVAHGVLAFVPQMVEAGIGHVVNTASQAGLATNTRCGVYAASKHAVVGLSEALYRELEGTSIGVSCLCPNAVSTSIFDVARLRPDWVEVTEADDEIQEAFSGVVRDNGIDPALVADEVVEAVKTGKFWVFTHEITKHIALSRFEDLETGGVSPNPQDLTRVTPTNMTATTETNR